MFAESAYKKILLIVGIVEVPSGDCVRAGVGTGTRWDTVFITYVMIILLGWLSLVYPDSH